MSRKSRDLKFPSVAISNDVIRQIRRHARSSLKTEVCGVLVGNEHGDGMEVEACIGGVNAEQAGAHVTFTQDTWEHIYKVKDQQYPNLRIVGWYHSHPGFGIFLSDHDTFIHKNFFSSPMQVAWVVDPHSDEEGCFGWVSGQIERLAQIQIIDRQRGDIGSRPEPILTTQDDDLNEEPSWQAVENNSAVVSWGQITATILSYLSILALGFLISWYLFPRVLVVPVPVDPITGQPLAYPSAGSDRPDLASPQNNQGKSSNPSSKPPEPAKGTHDQR